MQHVQTVVIDSPRVHELAYEILHDHHHLIDESGGTALVTTLAELLHNLSEPHQDAPLQPAKTPDAISRNAAESAGQRPRDTPQSSTHLIGPSPHLGDPDTNEEELRWESKAANELIAAWESRNIPKRQQWHMVNFMTQGFHEPWVDAHVPTFIGIPGRLEAWFEYSDQTDLRPWLDDAMKAAVVRWLNDSDIQSETLGLLPAMIRSSLGVAQIDSILNSDIPLHQLNIAFGPSAATPNHIRYGLLRHDTLYEWLNGSREQAGLEMLLELEPTNLSPLRQTAADTRDRLYRLIHISNAARSAMHGRAEYAGYAKRLKELVENWRAAVSVLNELLQPSLETDATADPARIARCLSNLCGRSNSQGRHLDALLATAKLRA
ncbi:MAG TPA: hypothetical protein VL522_09055 [Bordetella sp.]|nr:hypothetical protein [Bordetella sp.]